VVVEGRQGEAASQPPASAEARPAPVTAPRLEPTVPVPSSKT